MKTLHDILAGVTNGGKWEEMEVKCIICKQGGAVIVTPGVIEDEEYIVRACKTWPDLVRVLESIEAAGRPHGGPTEAPCGCDACGAWDTIYDILRKAME